MPGIAQTDTTKRDVMREHKVAYEIRGLAGISGTLSIYAFSPEEAEEKALALLIGQFSGEIDIKEIKVIPCRS